MPGQPMEEILASIKRIIAEDAPLSLGPPTLGGEPRRGQEADAEEVLDLDEPAIQRPADPAQAPPGWSTRSAPPAIDPLADPGPDPVFQDAALTVHEPREYFRGQPIAQTPTPEYVTSGQTLAPEPEQSVLPSFPAPVAHEPEPISEHEPMSEADPEPVAPIEPKPAFYPEGLGPAPEPAYESLLSASAEAASRQALAALNTLTIDSRAAPNTLDGLVREMLRPMVKDWLDKNLPPLVEQLVAKEIKRLAGA